MALESLYIVVPHLVHHQAALLGEPLRAVGLIAAVWFLVRVLAHVAEEFLDVDLELLSALALIVVFEFANKHFDLLVSTRWIDHVAQYE